MKVLKTLSAPTLSQLLNEANNNHIGDEEIVQVIKVNADLYTLVYKKTVVGVKKKEA